MRKATISGNHVREIPINIREPETTAPQHSAPLTSRECHESGGTSVTNQAKPRNPEDGAKTSRIRRNYTFIGAASGI